MPRPIYISNSCSSQNKENKSCYKQDLNIRDPDNLNNPIHPSGIEYIEVVRHFNFCIGNAIKYLWRTGIKQQRDVEQSLIDKEIEDCNKAIWYVQEHINTLKKTKL